MDLLENLKSTFQIEQAPLNTYSPLTLAFLGDCVFEIIIRTVVVERANRQTCVLHQKKSKIVNAGTQARLIEVMLPFLTEEEAAVYRRGKNAKVISPAKNADIKDYRKATGLEALCGYMFLKDDMERLIMLIKNGLDQLKIVI